MKFILNYDNGMEEENEKNKYIIIIINFIHSYEHI